MSLFYKILISISVFMFMEGVAWFTHKYIMHGILWSWHRSHHVHHKGIWERNDLFAVCFSFISIGFFVGGYFFETLGILTWIGFGILLYGIAYFIFHDIIVHRRIKIRFTAKNTYLKRIMKAHYVHHQVHTKNGAKAFGFLWTRDKYEK